MAARVVVGACAISVVLGAWKAEGWLLLCSIQLSRLMAL